MDTFRANITFGLEYNEERYKIAMKCCELAELVNSLPGGDLTEIGESGVSLSGGQMQRINIARAVYADADIYIIDSPLSALDFEIGSRILKNVFLGVLSSKTRIMCTQNLRYLKHFDMIYLMNNGKIDAFGVLDFIKLNKTFISLFDQDGSFNDAEYQFVTSGVDDKKTIESSIRKDSASEERQSIYPVRPGRLA